MDSIFELILVITIAVFITTMAYKILPFRQWRAKKPGFTLFPKYIAKFDRPIPEIEAELEKIGFKKSQDKPYVYSRGKISGDFSAKAIKLKVEIDEENSQIKVCASFFGILFDTGDIWQLTSDIVTA